MILQSFMIYVYLRRAFGGGVISGIRRSAIRYTGRRAGKETKNGERQKVTPENEDRSPLTGYNVRHFVRSAAKFRTINAAHPHISVRMDFGGMVSSFRGRVFPQVIYDIMFFPVSGGCPGGKCYRNLLVV